MRTGYWMGLVLGCAITAGAATVPHSFNYQGVLRGGSGELLPAGTKNVDFRIYTAANGSSAIWGRNYSILMDTNGLFNVALSDATGSLVTDPTATNALTSVLAISSSLYLGVKVDGATEIAPRQQLLSVPYALMSGDVKEASGNFTVNGILTARNGVTVTGTIQASDSIQVGNASNGVATLTANTGGTLNTHALTVNGNLTVPAPAKIAGYGTIPLKGIIMWSGSIVDIPDGWALCDGNNTTPDLRGKFIVGAGGVDYAVNAQGGTTNVTLTTNQIPAHGHAYEDGYYIEKDESGNLYPAGGSRTKLPSSVTGANGTDNDNNYMYHRPMTTDPTGGTASHENRPPYYALCYIMRIK